MSESEEKFSILSRTAALLIISAAGLILIVLLSGSHGSESLYWPGWFVLKVDSQTDTGSVDAELKNAGITGFISRDNSRVEYMSIPRMEQLEISEIDRVLIPGDPRRDPYISVIHKLFDSGDSSLIYLPSAPGIRHYRKIIQGIPGAENWTLMDDTAPFRGMTAVTVFTVLALLIGFTRGIRLSSLPRIISILPLSLYILSAGMDIGGMQMIFPLLMVYFLSPMNFRMQWNGKGHHKGRIYAFIIYAGYTAAAVSLVIISTAEGLFSLAAALSASELIVLVSPVLRKPLQQGTDVQTGKRNHFPKRREHELFVPLSLMQPARRVSRFSMKTIGAFLVVGCTIGSFFLPSFSDSQPSHTPIPHAVLTDSGFDDWSSFVTLDGSRKALNLPDAALMLSSAAYQEGFLFGSDFRLPLPGDSLSLRGFNTDGEGLSVTETVVKNYDKSWYESVLERELSHGAGLLFASLGGPSAVFTVSQVPGIEETHLNRIQIALYGIAVMAMLLLTIFPYPGEAPARSIYKPIMNARRRAQAA